MTPKEFSQKAASWGSFMTNGDPGACLYGFDDRGLVQSEEHRAECLAHIESHCRKAADTNVAAGDDPEGQHPELDALVAYLKAAPVEGAMPELDEFEAAYVEAMLFFTNDYSNDEGGDPMGDNYAPDHIDPETLARIRSDCARFQEMYGEHLTSENYSGRGESSPLARAGHDFFLTRGGHGAGFWDGDWEEPAATLLTSASKSFGEIEMYVGDDGRIHGSGGTPDPEPVEPGAAPRF